MSDGYPLLQTLAVNPVLQQAAPFLVLLLIPLLAFTLQANGRSITWSIAMVFDFLGLSFLWGGGSSGGHEKKIRKKHVRTRADQLALNGYAHHGSEKDVSVAEGYYPGLVNMSGTYCFMNSTLQALASLAYLHPHLDRIHAKAETLDVPTPVVDALRSLLSVLNAPQRNPASFRPMDIINSLSNHSPDRRNALFASREHQDAQELFQLLSECIKRESLEVEKEIKRDRGLGALARMASGSNYEIGRSPFDGLTANRRSCVECGYTEAVMHFPFDNWQLALPRYASCHLEDCLADYTRLEMLTDCICRKCSMLATHRRLVQEAERLTEAAAADHNPSSSRKKRAREARKLESRVKAAIEDGNIEEDIKGVKMEKVFSRASTKQAMIARPPQVLALHLNRSVHYGAYAAKNNCRILFPEVLDLTPFTTSGKLSTVPSIPISSPASGPPLHRSTTPTQATYASPRVYYRLSAVVCHYGQHSFGHYICFRRKPSSPSLRGPRLTPPRMACPYGCACEACQRYGPIRDDDGLPVPGRGWLRISDDSVRECGIDSVLTEGSSAFMLFYERVLHPNPNLYTLPKGSQETVTPRDIVHMDDDSGIDVSAPTTRALVMANGYGGEASRKPGPRIVHSFAAGRGKSLSATPSDSVSSSTAGGIPRSNGINGLNGILRQTDDDDSSRQCVATTATVDSFSLGSSAESHVSSQPPHHRTKSPRPLPSPPVPKPPRPTTAGLGA